MFRNSFLSLMIEYVGKTISTKCLHKKASHHQEIKSSTIFSNFIFDQNSVHIGSVNICYCNFLTEKADEQSILQECDQN